MAQVLPDSLRVEVGYGSTPLTALSSVTWTDVTSSVRLSEGVQFNRGRFGNDALARPGSLSFTLDNGAQKGSAGRFTSGGSKVKLRVPVRVRARFPYFSNLSPNPSFEAGSTSNWGVVGGATFAASTTRAYTGGYSGLVTWATGAGSSQYAYAVLGGLVIGTTYTFSQYVYVPTGSPDVYCAEGLGLAYSATLTTKNAWTRLSLSFTATSATHLVLTVNGTAATAGQTAYIDAALMEESASVSAYQDAVSADRTSLWVGYVESVQAGWDGGYRPVLRVSASDRLARLEKRKLPSLIRGVQSALGAVAMWPLDDAAGAATAGEQSPSTDAGNLIVRQLGTGGTLEFGQTGLGPSADGFACAIFTPAPGANDGKYLRTLTPGAAWQAATAAATHEVFFYYTGSGEASAILVPDGNAFLRVNIGASGKINLFYSTTSIGPDVPVDTWHHLAITQSLSGTTVTTKAYLNGVEFGSQTATVPAGANVNAVYVGGGDGTVFDGRMSHVACYPSVLSTTQIASNANLRHTLDSYTAEDADDVFNRICQAANLPATEYQVTGTTTVTMSPLPVIGSGLLDACNQVATAENGVIYLNRSGILTFAARSVRYNPTSAFSIPAKAIDRGTSFSTDMTYMVNDVTVARPAGSTSRYVDAASVAAYDTHDQNLEAYVATDNQAQELASRLARVNATPAPRVSDIKVDLVTGAADLDEDSILKAEIGTYFQVTSLPTGSPDSTLHLFVEGVAHEVTDSAWQVTMTTTPASLGFFRNVWKLGDASLSQLGSSTVLAF